MNLHQQLDVLLRKLGDPDAPDMYSDLVQLLSQFDQDGITQFPDQLLHAKLDWCNTQLPSYLFTLILSLTAGHQPLCIFNVSLRPEHWLHLWPCFIDQLALRASTWPPILPDEIHLPALCLAMALSCDLDHDAFFVNDTLTSTFVSTLHLIHKSPHLDDLHDTLFFLVLAINNKALYWTDMTPTTSTLPLPVNTPLLRTLCSNPSAASSITFAESLIFLLNRSFDPIFQLLLLKPLYILLSLQPDFFFTNDLRVLVNVLTRLLLDTFARPELCHALLRVLDTSVTIIPADLLPLVSRTVASVFFPLTTANAHCFDDTSCRLARRILSTIDEHPS